MATQGSQHDDLIIDLSYPGTTGRFDANSLVHRQLYDDVVRVVERYAQRARLSERPSAEPGGITEHVHQVIFIDGEPGSGKSSFLLNLANQIHEKCKTLSVLDVNVDPNRWPSERRMTPSRAGSHPDADRRSSEDCTAPSAIDFVLELVVIVGRQVEKLLQERASTHEDYRRAHEELTAAMEAHLLLRAAGSDSARDSAQSGAAQLWMREVNLGLQTCLSRYLHEACDILKRDALVLFVDDVDLMDHMAYALMEMLRVYAVSPRLIVVWASNKRPVLDVLFEVLKVPHRRPARETGDGSARPSSEDELTLARVDQYWRKIVPSFSEFRLPTLGSIVRSRDVRISCKDKRVEAFSLAKSHQKLRDALGYLPPPDFGLCLRDWMDMLYTLRDWWLAGASGGPSGSALSLREIPDGLDADLARLWRSVIAQEQIDRAQLPDWQKVFFSVVAAADIADWPIEGPLEPPAGDSLDIQLTLFVSKGLRKKWYIWHAYCLALAVSSACADWSIGDFAAFLEALEKEEEGDAPAGLLMRFRRHWCHPDAPWHDLELASGSVSRMDASRMDASRMDASRLGPWLEPIRVWHDGLKEEGFFDVASARVGLWCRNTQGKNPLQHLAILKSMLYGKGGIAPQQWIKHPLLAPRPQENTMRSHPWELFIELVQAVFALETQEPFRARLDILASRLRDLLPLSLAEVAQLQLHLMGANRTGVLARYCRPDVRGRLRQDVVVALQGIGQYAALGFDPVQGFFVENAAGTHRADPA